MNALQQALILDAVSYKDWTLYLGQDDDRSYLQWQFMGPCAKSREWTLQHCRKWFLSLHMTESELVQTAFVAALQAEEHECREFFAYRGTRPFNPHISVQALMTICHQEDVRESIKVSA